MNNPYHIYNPNIPFINHTDWASVAKQWATLRADVNIPQLIPEHHNFQAIPPPPPPSPPFEHSMAFQSNPYDNYQHNNSQFNNHQDLNNENINLSVSPNMNITYQPPAYTIFEKNPSSIAKSNCETFDYNHGNRPYEYYNNAESFKQSKPISYTQNMWNLPPPDHPDIVRSNINPNVFSQPENFSHSEVFNQRDVFTQPEVFTQPQVFSQPESFSQPKLFPILNSNDFHSAPITCTPSLQYSKNSPMPQSMESKMYAESRFDTNFVAAKPSKSLPAWIIDDMKKMKEKERKQTYHSMDIYRDNPVYSRRDEEGDVVMEDVNREPISDIMAMSGKSVTKHSIDHLAPETDIIDVSAHDDEPIIGKINYSSKSLMELIEMLDESEIETLKIAVIRDSLTDVMKEITDDLIFATVKSTFSRELSRGKKTHKHKGKGNSFDSSTKNQKSEPVSQLLGLDVYESEDEDDDIKQEPKLEFDHHKPGNTSRDKSSSNKIKSESDVKSSKPKLSSDKTELTVKEKENVSSESSSKRKHRSKSHDNEKSKSKRKSHKKSKKHSDSIESKDDVRKSEYHVKSSSSRKKN